MIRAIKFPMPPPRQIGIRHIVAGRGHFGTNFAVFSNAIDPEGP